MNIFKRVLHPGFICLIAILFSINKLNAQASVYATTVASGSSNKNISVDCEGSSMQLLLIVHYTGFNYVSATYKGNTSSNIGNVASGNDHITLFQFTPTSTGVQTVSLSVVGTGTYYAEAMALKNVNGTGLSITTTSMSGTTASVSVSGDSKDILIGGIFDYSGSLSSTTNEEQSKLASFTSPYAGQDAEVAASATSKLSWSFSCSSSYMTWAMRIRGNSPLPISLLSFDAQYENESNLIAINWSTASEENNKYFTIEKTADGINYTTVATIAGAGNSNRVLNYSAIDESPWSGSSYYRLKQTDFDGNYTYSQNVIVVVPIHQSVHIYPNPASDKATISFNAESPAPVEVEVYNAQGMLVNTFNIANVQIGDNNVELNISSLSQGMYILKLIGGSSVTSHKLIKQ